MLGPRGDNGGREAQPPALDGDRHGLHRLRGTHSPQRGREYGGPEGEGVMDRGPSNNLKEHTVRNHRPTRLGDETDAFAALVPEGG